jgi:hypothetical protein
VQSGQFELQSTAIANKSSAALPINRFKFGEFDVEFKCTLMDYAIMGRNNFEIILQKGV